MTFPSAIKDYNQRKRESAELDPYIVAALMDDVATPEQELIAKQEAQRIDRFIDRMPLRVGLAFRLRYGYRCRPHTLEQVAERFGVTRERIRQLAHKGERVLQRLILIEDNPRKLREIRAREAEQECVKKQKEDAAWQAASEARRVYRVVEEAKWLARQRAKREVERVQAAYDRDWYEAHEINADWDKELQRRAGIIVRSLARMAKQTDQRIIEARKMERELQQRYWPKPWPKEYRIGSEKPKPMTLEQAYRIGSKGYRSYKVKRDWLIVGST